MCAQFRTIGGWPRAGSPGGANWQRYTIRDIMSSEYLEAMCTCDVCPQNNMYSFS